MAEDRQQNQARIQTSATSRLHQLLSRMKPKPLPNESRRFFEVLGLVVSGKLASTSTDEIKAFTTVWAMIAASRQEILTYLAGEDADFYLRSHGNLDDFFRPSHAPATWVSHIDKLKTDYILDVEHAAHRLSQIVTEVMLFPQDFVTIHAQVDTCIGEINGAGEELSPTTRSKLIGRLEALKSACTIDRYRLMGTSEISESLIGLVLALSLDMRLQGELQENKEKSRSILKKLAEICTSVIAIFTAAEKAVDLVKSLEPYFHRFLQLPSQH